MDRFVPPTFEADAFTCPWCDAYAQQGWSYLVASHTDRLGHTVSPVSQSSCRACGEAAYWLDEVLLFPSAGGIEPAHPDLPETLKKDYLEARDIATRSPRAASALLRSILESLCLELGEPGENLNADIGSLVAKRAIGGRTQRAADALRVVGNDSLHPRTMQPEDTRETALALFRLVNVFVQDAITDSRVIDRVYEGLPEDTRRKIDKRDARDS